MLENAQLKNSMHTMSAVAKLHATHRRRLVEQSKNSGEDHVLEVCCGVVGGGHAL